MKALEFGTKVKIVVDRDGLLGREGCVFDTLETEDSVEYQVELKGDMGFWWVDHQHLEEV